MQEKGRYFARFLILLFGCIVLYFYWMEEPEKEDWQKNFFIQRGMRQEISNWMYQTYNMDTREHDNFPIEADIESDWAFFQTPHHPRLFPGDAFLVMKTILPKEAQGRDWLFFKSMNQSFRIWVDGKRFYAYGSMEKGKHFRGRGWHLIKLPKGYGEKEMVIKAYSEDQFSLGVFEFMSLGTESEQVGSLFYFDFIYLMGIPVAIFLLAIMISYLHHARARKYFFLIGLFCLDYIFWSIGMINTARFLLDAPLFLWMLHVVTGYFMPILATLFVRDMVEECYKKWLSYIVLYYVALFFLAVVLEIFITGYYICSLEGVFFGSFCILSPYVYYTLYRSGKMGNSDAAHMCWCYAFCILLGFLDGMNRITHFINRDILFTALSIWSLVPFTMYLIRSKLHEEEILTQRACVLEKNVVNEYERFYTDSLTNCYNRYQFKETYQKFSAIACTGVSLACILLDIDFFKRVNDIYGHDAGDVVLKNFADTLRAKLDRRHVLFRWGGEEFIILCLHYDLCAALEFADELRRMVEHSAICAHAAITCSIGVSVWREGDTAKTLVKRADEALYQAKESGRNQVVREDEGKEKRKET